MYQAPATELIDDAAKVGDEALVRKLLAPDHETPTQNGALEYLLDDHLPVFWKRLFALTFARVPGHAVAGDEYLARHLGSFLVGDDLLK